MGSTKSSKFIRNFLISLCIVLGYLGVRNDLDGLAVEATL